jgi:hypothetical protein
MEIKRIDFIEENGSISCIGNRIAVKIDRIFIVETKDCIDIFDRLNLFY